MKKFCLSIFLAKNKNGSGFLKKDAIHELENDTMTVLHNEKADAETQLWVEKFKPKDYFELLSDDVSFYKLYLTFGNNFQTTYVFLGN